LLAEAFTRPKMMKALAKAGFTQSYTYFTWRNHKRELEEYVTELTRTEMRDYFVPNFFANTHDVLSESSSGRPPAFRLRLVLAATLSPSYGIYSGYELSERAAVPAPSSTLIRRSSRSRHAITTPGQLERAHRAPEQDPARQRGSAALCEPRVLEGGRRPHHGVPEEHAGSIEPGSVVVNLDPAWPRHAVVEVPGHLIGRGSGESYLVTDLLTGQRYTWGEKNYVRLDPSFLLHTS